MASPSRDSEAKRFLPAPGKANVFVVRHGGVAWLDAILVNVDEEFAGTLDPGRYQVFSLNPGEHSLRLSANGNASQGKFQVEAGHNYFFRAYVVGFSNQPLKLDPAGDQEGRQWVLNSKLAATIRSETEQLIK